MPGCPALLRLVRLPVSATEPRTRWKPSCRRAASRWSALGRTSMAALSRVSRSMVRTPGPISSVWGSPGGGGKRPRLPNPSSHYFRLRPLSVARNYFSSSWKRTCFPVCIYIAQCREGGRSGTAAYERRRAQAALRSSAPANVGVVEPCGPSGFAGKMARSFRRFAGRGAVRIGQRPCSKT